MELAKDAAGAALEVLCGVRCPGCSKKSCLDDSKSPELGWTVGFGTVSVC